MKRTRRWQLVKQDAIRFAALGLSDIEIGKRLDVDRATVFRWRKAGKLKGDPGKPRDPLVVTKGKTPAQWAAAVRAAYDLDETDAQIVTMAETCLLIERDPNAAPPLRLAAMREFRASVKQLALVTRSGKGEQSEPEHGEAKRKTFPVQARSGGDPRGVLEAVK